jgi:cytochrome c oxidase cbb3-type subunit 4
MEIETLTAIREWAYIIFTGIMVILLYSYIYYLYDSEKKGKKDYEKFSQIALDDEIDSTPIQSTSAWEKKDAKGENE